MYNFSSDLVGSLDIARTYAAHHRHTTVTPLHMVYGLAKNPNLAIHQALNHQLTDLQLQLDKLPQVPQKNYVREKLAPDSGLIDWLGRANAQSTQEGRSEITLYDLLASAPDQVLEFLPERDIWEALLEHGGESEVPEFLIDLCERARQGKVDPVIGRAREIRNIFEVLGRRSKNNPILLGEAGVGKTAVVEGLAHMIVSGDVPKEFLETTIYSLDLAALMAGTKYRGDFEERLHKLIQFAHSLSGRAIIFFDEIHTLIGAGKSEGAASDGANLLKPALARGDLKCIGATTHHEYQKYFMADSALDRRFRPIIIREPSVESSLEILMGLKDRFEAHHGLTIETSALHHAVFLSSRYVQHRHLPDKAIDLIDEACSAKKFSLQSMPRELLELESEWHAKKTLAQTEQGHSDLVRQVQQLEDDLAEKKASWEKEVKQLREFAALKKLIETRHFEQQAAQKAGEFEKASRLKYSELPELEKRLESYKVTTSLTKVDIADVLSAQTGIPKDKILASKQERILSLEPFLNSRVFAQEGSMHEIAETLITAYAGLSEPSRPLGSFLLCGPSGVGKTETAKALSEFFFEDPDQVIRIDLSEYAEKHSIAKLIGAPSGYVGYDDGGFLTEAVRRRPYSIVLFDELEKAHPDFADLLLQILDDGRLTDNKGRVISFRNTCVLLTTNSQNIEDDFKPEVLGRLDSILSYRPLDSQVMKRLVLRELGHLNDSLRRKKISVEISARLEELIVAQGFHASYGARPLKAYFQKKVVRPISRKILEGDLLAGVYHLDVSRGDEEGYDSPRISGVDLGQKKHEVVVTGPLSPSSEDRLKSA